MQRVLAVLMTMAMVTTVSADPKPKLDPKDTAVIDQAFHAVERLATSIYAGRGKCSKITQAIKATLANDNKLAAELEALTSGPNAAALQEYGKRTYERTIYGVQDKVQRGTLYCRADVAAAWKENHLAIAALGALPADEPARERKAPLPKDYEARLEKYDAALEAYLAIGDKFDDIDNDNDCNQRAKLIPEFAAIHKKQSAMFDAFDKAMQAALVEDNLRMLRQGSPYISFMSARGKCAKNRAFMKATKAAKLEGKT